jgi:hypothetical protein
MAIVANIMFFSFWVLLAALIMLRRRADDWEGIPFSKRFVLAVIESRYWWLAYSFGWFFVCIFRYKSSFDDVFPVVLIAVAAVILISFLRSQK